MNLIKQKEYLKKAFWDSNYSSDDLLSILYKKKQDVKGLTLEKLYLRLLETYSWHKLIDIVPEEQLQEMLSDDILKKLRSEKLGKRFHDVAELLRRHTVSAAG